MLSLVTDLLLALSDRLTFSQAYYPYTKIYAMNKKSSHASLRVTLNRLVKRGWVDKITRNGIVCFRLNSQGAKKLKDVFFIDQPNQKWDGRWRIIISRKMERAKVRDLGLGIVQKGVYASPFSVAENLFPGALVFETNRLLSLESKALADRVWKLKHLANRYHSWIASVAGSPRKEKEVSMLVKEYQKILENDPRLPVFLLPSHWPGPSAASVFTKLVRQRFSSEK